MQIRKLSIQGFRTFTDKQEFYFDGDPGLYFLTGQNDINPTLGANGTGKSTVLDALVFVLSGTTCRDLKSRDILSWYSESPDLEVLLEFAIDNSVRTIRRTSKKIYLSKDSDEEVEATQEDIEDITLLTKPLILRSLIIPQFGTMLFDETPAKQNEIFSEILDLSDWDIYAENAKKKRDYTKSFLSDIVTDINTTEAQIKTLVDQTFHQEIAEWEDEHIKAIDEHERSLKSQNLVLDKIERDIEKEKGSIDAASKEVNALEGLMSELETRISEPEEGLELVSAKYNKKLGEKSSVLAAKKHLENLGSVCKHCLQKVDEKHFQTSMSDYDDLLKKHNEELEQLSSEKQELEESFEEIEDELSDAERDLERAREKLTRHKNTKRSLESELRSGEAALERIGKLLDREKEKACPYHAIIEKNKTQADAKRQFVDLKQKEKVETEAYLEALNYWVTGFKSAKLLIIDDVVSQLETVMNDVLLRLGMDGWSVKLQTTRTTAANEIRQKFTVVITSPANEKAVNWKSWSGGETQRLRVAGIIALSELLLSSKGINLNVEFWDEPTNGINPEGVEVLVNSLRTYARQNNKQVWLIDHRSLHQSDFEEIITVVKDEKGSYLVDGLEA